MDELSALSAAHGQVRRQKKIEAKANVQSRKAKHRRSQSQQLVQWQLLGGAADGNAEAIIEAITNGADVNFEDTPNQFSSSALMIAASGGHAEAVDILLLYGADKSKTNHFGQTAAEMAHESGFHDIGQRLEFEANFSTKGTVVSPKPASPAPVPQEEDNSPHVKETRVNDVQENESADVVDENAETSAQLCAQLESLNQQLKEARQKLASAEQRGDLLREELEASVAKCKEAEDRSDKAAECALDMQEELVSIMTRREELEEEHEELLVEKEQLIAQLQ